jgi:hypothetical protein
MGQKVDEFVALYLESARLKAAVADNKLALEKAKSLAIEEMNEEGEEEIVLDDGTIVFIEHVEPHDALKVKKPKKKKGETVFFDFEEKS